jgi:hypothetical protein
MTPISERDGDDAFCNSATSTLFKDFYAYLKREAGCNENRSMCISRMHYNLSHNNNNNKSNRSKNRIKNSCNFQDVSSDLFHWDINYMYIKGLITVINKLTSTAIVIILKTTIIIKTTITSTRLSII